MNIMSKQKKKGKRNWLNKHKKLVIWISSIFIVLLCICGGTVLYYRSLAKDYVRYLALQGRAIAYQATKYDKLNSEHNKINDIVPLAKQENFDFPDKKFMRNVKDFKGLYIQNNILAYPYFKMTINQNSLGHDGKYHGYNQVNYYDKNKSILKTNTDGKVTYSYSPLDAYLQDKSKIINGDSKNKDLYMQTVAGHTLTNATFAFYDPFNRENFVGLIDSPYKLLMPGNLYDINLSPQTKNIINTCKLDVYKKPVEYQTLPQNINSYYTLPNLVYTKHKNYKFAGSVYNLALNNLIIQNSFVNSNAFTLPHQYANPLSDEAQYKFIYSKNFSNSVLNTNNFFGTNAYLNNVFQEFWQYKYNDAHLTKYSANNLSQFKYMPILFSYKPNYKLYQTKNNYILDTTLNLNVTYNQLNQLISFLENRHLFNVSNTNEFEYNLIRSDIKMYKQCLTYLNSSDEYLNFSMHNQIVYDKQNHYIKLSNRYSNINLIMPRSQRILAQKQEIFQPVNDFYINIPFAKKHNSYKAISLDKQYIKYYQQMFCLNKYLNIWKNSNPVAYRIFRYYANIYTHKNSISIGKSNIVLWTNNVNSFNVFDNKSFCDVDQQYKYLINKFR